MSTPLDRALFAVTESYAYLNHAAVGVLPKPTRDALRAFLDAHANAGVAGVFPYERRMEEYRECVARFIGARPGTIAILRNTGDGANAIVRGLRWEPGDQVLLPDNEFPANAIPWLAVRRFGAEVCFIETARERLTPDVMRRRISDRTKVVALSWVSFEDGYRHDLEPLAAIAHERGALFCVDAIQGLGVFPIDVGAIGIDALYGGGAKWMLALQGVGFLYLAPALRERLELAWPGWRSMADMWDFRNYDQPFTGDASRFEGGTPIFIGALSLAESIRVLERAGSPVAPHVLALTDHLVEGLRGAGADIASIRGAAESSGIVTFTLPDVDSIDLGRRLQREGIVTTYRANGIRVAPHGYNTIAEIDRLLTAVRCCKKEDLCLP